VKIAILIAAYNAAPFIGDALASLLRQRDAAELDIIVVDDGSTDGTGAILARVASEAPEVRIATTPNRGIARTRNELLRMLAPDTDLVTLLDADDLSPAGRLARDLERFAEDPGLDLTYGTARLFRLVGEDPLAPDPDGPMLDVRGVVLGCGLFRHSLIRRVGSFDESFEQGEDMDFLFRVFELEPRYRLLDDICYYYRRHGNNTTLDRAGSRRGAARAMMRAIQRRRDHGAPLMPPGIFDPKDMIRMGDF
jgi:glycosyltransferase involved in cell wall biosynthesis